MTESGYSWPEAMLALLIMMLVFSTLLPLSVQMLAGLDEKKYEMWAKETMYQGALLYTSYGIMSGIRVEQGMEYRWTANKDQLCVQYMRKETNETLCTR